MLIRAAWSICLGLLFTITVIKVQANTISISFDQLEDLAWAQSPGGKIIKIEYNRTLAERDDNLKWSNPKLSYNHEGVETAEEYQVTIGKQFELPWAYQKKRSSWKDRVRSGELQQEQRMTNHLADLKVGYVAVQLNQQYVSRLQQIRETLTDASHAATSRYTEGHLSGVEEHLIQMVLISTNASYQDAMQLQRETEAAWRAAIGFSLDDSLILETNIVYQPVHLQPTDYYISLIDSQPGLLAMQTLQQSLSKQSAAERASFIPSIDLYGGYKKINQDFDGYVAGVSLSVPLFNRNRAASRKYEAESNIAGHETQLYRSQNIGLVKALVSSILESQDMLGMEAGHFDEDMEAFSSLLYTYEEGWITLNELLNAIQIEVNGLKAYYSQFIRYYENIFALEALTGESLITF